MKQPYDSFLTVLVITGIPSPDDQTYSVGLQKIEPQKFIAPGRVCPGLEGNLKVSDL